ncbi:13415_t:CDS:1 [Acaulospora colombiana]|uniref:13415_t:CDS:1 n=1 Tax=Acaulospora colombiana TaxID=27376 RepID=A0ACA9LPQ2_9GLOM|nr:13415_t:CDS:1 [Acaulospora colombiana]
MIFYCGKVVLLALLVALALATALPLDDPSDESVSTEVSSTTETTTSDTNSQNPLQNTVLQAVLGILVGAIGIAVCAGGFYCYCKRKKDRDDDKSRDISPIITEPLIDLQPKDTIASEVSAVGTDIGPHSTIISAPEGAETSRTGEHEKIVVTPYGPAKDVDPSKLGVSSQEIHGTHHISSSSVDLSQGQGPSGNDFE